jgi:hypothetical protein
MRMRRKFIARRRVDDQLHSIPRSKSTLQLQTALRTGHFTLDDVMTLQKTAGNQATIQRVGDGEPQTSAEAQTEAEKRLKEIIASLNPKKDEKGDAEQYKKALQEALKALMETSVGKELKKKAIELATNKQNLPLTILLGSGALGALFATNAGIPSIPDIPVGEGMSIGIDLEGTMREPSGIKFTFKFKFGGGSKEKGPNESSKVKELPPALVDALKDIDETILQQWILARAQHEYEKAPDEQKAAKRELYNELKADVDSLPNTMLVVEALAHALMKNPGEKRIEFDLHYNEMWDSFSDLAGLTGILSGIVAMIVPTLPEVFQTVEQITFKAGKKIIPIPIKKPEAEATAE